VARIWTLQEANDALPMVRGLLADARRHLDGSRAAEDQLLDLRTLHGDAVMAAAHPANPEWRAWAERLEQARSALVGALAQFDSMGIEPKDIEQGLIDFRGRIGDHAAYLCWKEPEERIGWWHTLEGGFSGRKPVPTFTLDEETEDGT